MKGFNKFLSLILATIMLLAVTVSSSCTASDLRITKLLGLDKDPDTVVVTENNDENADKSDEEEKPQTHGQQDGEETSSDVVEQEKSTLPDNLLFYKYYSEFNQAQHTLKLDVTDVEMLAAYIDYVRFYNIKNKVGLTLKYSAVGFKEECDKAKLIYDSNERLTIGCSILTEYSGKSGNYYITESDADNTATKTFDTEREYVSSQVDYALKMSAPNVRAEDFDAFALNSVTKAIGNISSSEQLRWAIQNGYKPECVKDSPAERTLNGAKTVLRSIISDEMDDITKLRAIYEWLALNVCYDNYAASAEVGELIASGALKTSEYDAWYAEGVFDNRKAVCEGYAKALIVMAGLEGIPAVLVTGNGHAWNRVLINGKWYVVDATHADVHVGENEVFSYGQFLITDAEKTHRGYTSSDYSDCAAETEYDVFANTEIEILGQKSDLIVDSGQELVAVLEYAKIYGAQGSTVDVCVKKENTDKVDLWLLSPAVLLLYEKRLEPDADINGNAHYTFYLK